MLILDRKRAEEVVCNGWGVKKILVPVVLRCAFFQRYRSVSVQRKYVNLSVSHAPGREYEKHRELLATLNFVA